MTATISTQNKLLIGNQWVEGQGPEFASTSPSDGSIVWKGNEASNEQIAAAFHSARQAFGDWWNQSLESRIEFCQQFAEAVADRKNELAELIAREIGKPLWESKTEAGAVSGKVGLSIQALRERRDKQSFDMSGVDAVTRFKPHGVLSVLGPFNFPAHLPNGHIVPALLAGNTIVFKPSEQTPAVGTWMVERWLEAGLPPGVVNLVHGAREVGISISQQDELDGILFTGSSAAGKALHRTFADHPQKILALEMGGNNPLVVFQPKNLDAAAYLTIMSAYISAGQRCTCARRLILVEDSTSDQYLKRLVEMIGKVRFGFWNDDPEPFLGTVISGEQGRRVQAAFGEMVSRGGSTLVEPQSHRNCDALISPGLIDVTGVSNRGDDEVFGPILNLIRVSSLDEAIKEANNTAYGLSAGILSQNAEAYEQFIHECRAGIVNWNRQTTGASGKLPFGGSGLSGNHRPAGYYAADYCSFPVASLEANSLEMPESTAIGIDL